MQFVFDSSAAEDDSDRIVRTFFETVLSRGCFLKALEMIVLKHGFVSDEEGCSFPDWDDAPELHFHGVMFFTFQEKTVITEQRCREYIDAACAEHMWTNLDDAEKVRQILRKRLF